MIILGIETSCDETAAAVLQKTGDRIEILSNVIASSASLQSKYGGIIPEQAAREQIKSIIPVIETAINDSLLTINELDAIAVTSGPGLIGSLLVGVETAKVLSLTWDKPLIPVNHLLGHFYANWITEDVSSIKYQVLRGKTEKKTHNTKYVIHNTPKFPCLGLLVSGGHTDLVLFKNHLDYQYLGGTRDDAAGECFDKCARLLGLPYPGGPQISQLAQKGDPKKYHFPRPMMDSGDFDFSYSGLKTSVSNMVDRISKKRNNKRLTINDKRDLCASLEQAIITTLIRKTLQAVKKFNIQTIILGGGVAANNKLRSELELHARRYTPDAQIFVPQKSLCTDNAAMIASHAFFEKPLKDPKSLQANPNLSLET